MTNQIILESSARISFIRLLIFPSLVLLSLFACRKDKTESLLDENGCTKIIRCKTNILGYNTQMNFPIHSNPMWNPTNPDEILYTKYIANNYKKVILHNILTGEKRTVFEGNFFQSFNEVQEDWILVLNSDYQVYKIKIDGTGLTQLTHTGKYYAPKFYHEVGKFYVQDLSLNDQLILIKMDGTILDTLPGAQVSKGEFYNNRFLLCDMINQKVFIKGLNDEILYQFDYSFQNPNPDLSLNLGAYATWIDENNILYGHEKGYYLLNLLTNESRKINSRCSMLYFPLTSKICSNGSQILQSKCTLEQPDECTLIYSSYIFLTDLNGNNPVYVDYRD